MPRATKTKTPEVTTPIEDVADVTDSLDLIEPQEPEVVLVDEVEEPVVVVNPAQAAMLAIAAQNEYRETKAMDEVAARQARFNSDNQMAQQLAAIPQHIERTKAALAKGRKPKQLQEPAPTTHPVKGVVIDPNATPEADQDNDQ